MGFKQLIHGIRWLVFMDEYEFVHIFNLEMTSMKCNHNVGRKKINLCLNLVCWDAKNMSH